MIIQVSGEFIAQYQHGNYKNIDVLTSTGVGYRVLVPVNHFEKASGNLLLFTSLQVREDSQTLYGFEDLKSRDFFEVLIGVSGIGPKIAMSILATYPVSKVKELILATDHKGLSKVSGLGAKGAKKIILELAGELSSMESDAKSLPSESEVKMKDIRDALRTLGFKGDEMDEMAKKAEDLLSENEEIDVEKLLGMVLRS